MTHTYLVQGEGLRVGEVRRDKVLEMRLEVVLLVRGVEIFLWLRATVEDVEAARLAVRLPLLRWSCDERSIL
jgi:hypothetical protein